MPSAYRALYDLNPFVVLLDGYRATLLHGGLPNFVGLSELGAVGAAMVVAGHFLFRRASHNFAEEI